MAEGGVGGFTMCVGFEGRPQCRLVPSAKTGVFFCVRLLWRFKRFYLYSVKCEFNLSQHYSSVGSRRSVRLSRHFRFPGKVSLCSQGLICAANADRTAHGSRKVKRRCYPRPLCIRCTMVLRISNSLAQAPHIVLFWNLRCGWTASGDIEFALIEAQLISRRRG